MGFPKGLRHIQFSCINPSPIRITLKSVLYPNLKATRTNFKFLFSACLNPFWTPSIVQTHQLDSWNLFMYFRLGCKHCSTYTGQSIQTSTQWGAQCTSTSTASRRQLYRFSVLIRHDTLYDSLYCRSEKKFGCDDWENSYRYTQHQNCWRNRYIDIVCLNRMDGRKS